MLFLKKCLSTAEELRDHPIFVSLRDGVLWSFVPIGIAMVLLFFYMFPEKNWSLRFMDIYLSSLGVMGPGCAFLIAQFLSRSYKVKSFAGPVSLAVYLALIHPIPISIHSIVDVLRDTFTSGPFVGLFLAVALGGFVIFLRKKWPKIGLAAELFALLLGFLFIVFLEYFHLDLHRLIRMFFSEHMVRTDTLAAAVFIVFSITFLWFFGLQGTAIIGSFITGIYAQLAFENMQAVAHGHSPHHIITLTFLNYVFVGGAGTTLVLPFFMLFSRSHKMRVLGGISAVPVLFNINETLIYFMPLVLNSYLAIPFFITPLFITISTYYAIRAGWIPAFCYYIPGIYYIPSPLLAVIGTTANFFLPHHWSDFHWLLQRILAGGSWKSGIFCLLQIVCVAFFYYPFYRAYDQKLAAEEKKKEKEATSPVESQSVPCSRKLLLN